MTSHDVAEANWVSTEFAADHSPSKSWLVPKLAQVVCDAVRNQIRVKVMKWKVKRMATARFHIRSLFSQGLTFLQSLYTVMPSH